ncbi:uncharacterized protein G2W53_035029 [Senna tora]|uniref:Uncharacterized protein n=1 Tax=Senna tora TaxID=362788 RepID=A0A834SRM9_9FABA|nr:uncharacterized protein G2W53_035029 [Senna tora]
MAMPNGTPNPEISEKTPADACFETMDLRLAKLEELFKRLLQQQLSNFSWLPKCLYEAEFEISMPRVEEESLRLGPAFSSTSAPVTLAIIEDEQAGVMISSVTMEMESIQADVADCGVEEFDEDEVIVSIGNDVHDLTPIAIAKNEFCSCKLEEEVSVIENTKQMEQIFWLTPMEIDFSLKSDKEFWENVGDFEIIASCKPRGIVKDWKIRLQQGGNELINKEEACVQLVPLVHRPNCHLEHTCFILLQLKYAFPSLIWRMEIDGLQPSSMAED